MRVALAGGALLALLLVSSALAAPAQNVAPEVPRCHGRRAEIVGSDGNDVIRGTPERDVIAGGKGDDVIFGSLGNDLICGGPGTDEMHGGRGNDEVDGGSGDEDQVKRAVDNGAEVVVGGKRDGNFFEPTILTGIEPGDEASQEEFFGPVAQVYRVGSEEEAVDLANQTPFGLGSYLMTNDEEQASRVADRIEAGMVYVNLVGADSPELPFGGFKRSGFGRELGRYGADEFVNKKLIRSA